MDNIIKQYKNSFAEHGNSPNSVFWPKGRQAERFKALTQQIATENFSVLDFGCGLAHLRNYLTDHFSNQNIYTGADIVDDFIQENKKNFPKDTFTLIQSHKDISEEYDYIVSSGAFNMLYTDNIKDHKEIIFDILSHLFSKSKIYLSVNFMTDAVDFIQPGAYHQNIPELYDFITKNLSKRVVIDQSYMPYEYTVTIFKNQNILRPENIYSNE
jgi:trans-aconitate methyltransferase